MFWDPRNLLAQKISSSGSTLWNAPGLHVVVFDGGSLQIGNFPDFVTDGNGGAVFSWYGVSPLQCYVQRILADGSEAFVRDGVAALTDVTRVRVSPDVSFRPATGEIFLFWTEENASQSRFGLYGQKFDSAGTRRWTDTGRELIPLGTTDILSVRNLPYADGAMVFHLASAGFGNDLVYASRVDGNGAFVWPDGMIQACSLPSGKGRLEGSMSAADYAILAWEDDRAGDRDIYGQNVNPDGTLGGPGGADTFDMAIACLTLTLNLPDTARIRIGVTNTSGGTIDLLGHLDATLCDGTPLADLLRHGLRLGAGETRVFDLPVFIPARPVTCDCHLGIAVFLQDTATLWKESDSCGVTTTCP